MEVPMYCKEGTCSFCGKFSTLCSDIEQESVENWGDVNNNPILCQECDDLCWVHERPVNNTPSTACVCEMRVENNA